MNVYDEIRSEVDGEEQEAWKADESLKLCWRLEDLLRIGMRRYRNIRELDDAWSRKVQEGLLPFDAGKVRFFRKEYQKWFAPCDKVLKLIEAFEKDYAVVEGADEFRRARILVQHILATPLERVIESMEQIERGEYHILNDE